MGKLGTVKNVKKLSAQSICIIDNSMMDVIEKILNFKLLNFFFDYYDYCIIPSWVKIEIEDSQSRRLLLEKFQKTFKNYVVFIDEKDYEQLLEHRDLIAVKFFEYACMSYAKQRKYIKENLGLINWDNFDFKKWVDDFYNNAFEEGKRLASGRIRKKNAGDISIVVLSLILSSLGTHNRITVWTNDIGIYDMFQKAKKEIEDDAQLKQLGIEIKRSPSVKTINVLLQEAIRHELNSDFVKLLKTLRGTRETKYIFKKTDNTVEEYTKTLAAEDFLQLVKNNENVTIIY